MVDALEGNFVASFESGGLDSGAVDEDGEGCALQVAQHRLAAAQLQRRVLARHRLVRNQERAVCASAGVQQAAFTQRQRRSILVAHRPQQRHWLGSARCSAKLEAGGREARARRTDTSNGWILTCQRTKVASVLRYRYAAGRPAAGDAAGASRARRASRRRSSFSSSAAPLAVCHRLRHRHALSHPAAHRARQRHPDGGRRGCGRDARLLALLAPRAGTRALSLFLLHRHAAASNRCSVPCAGTCHPCIPLQTTGCGPACPQELYCLARVVSDAAAAPPRHRSGTRAISHARRSS